MLLLTELFLRSSYIKTELKQLKYSYLLGFCMHSKYTPPEFEARCQCCLKRRGDVLLTSSTGKYAEYTISCLRCNIERVFMRSKEQNLNTFTPLPPCMFHKTTKFTIFSQSITVFLIASFSIF